MAQLGRIPVLVRRLRRGSPGQQAAAASELWHMPVEGAVADALVAAGAVPILVQVLSTSRSGDHHLKCEAASILTCLAINSEQRAEAIVAAGGPAALVQLMRSDSADLQQSAAGTLMQITAAADAAAAPVAAAGGIELAVQRLTSSSRVQVAEASAALLANLANTRRSESFRQAIHAAGGIPPLVADLQRGSSDMLHEGALKAIHHLAPDSAERCQAIAAAGGARACMRLFAHPRDGACLAGAGGILVALARNGQSQAVHAADPFGAYLLALEEQVQLATDADFRQDVAEALHHLVAACAAAQAAGAAAAPSPAAPRQPRVCAAPGCSVTTGLERCSACGSVRYCSAACQAAHWKEHRPVCKRVRAERAATAAAEAAGSSQAGPSFQR